MNKVHIAFIGFAALSLSACSQDDDAKTKDDHVFKEKTETIDKARDVASQLSGAAARQAEAAKKAAQ